MHVMMVKRKVMRHSPLSTGMFYGKGVTVLTCVRDLLIAVNTDEIKAEIST